MFAAAVHMKEKRHIWNESLGFLQMIEIRLQYFRKHLLIQADLAVHITPTTTYHISNSGVYFPTLRAVLNLSHMSHTSVLTHSSLP